MHFLSRLYTNVRFQEIHIQLFHCQNESLTLSIAQRLDEVDGTYEDYLHDQPRRYAYEGQGSRCQSLDGMTLSNLGEDLGFLDDLDPKFTSLAGVCRSAFQERKAQH